MRSRALTIVEASRRGAGLARQLLAFSGLNSSKLEICKAEDEVKRAIDICQGTLGAVLLVSSFTDSAIEKGDKDDDTPHSSSRPLPLQPIEANKTMLVRSFE